MAGPIKIAILADTKEFGPNLDKAQSNLDDLAQHADKAASKVDSSMAGVADAADGVASASSQAAGGLGDLGGALSMMPGPLGALGSSMEAVAPAIMGVTGAADLLNLAGGKFPKIASGMSTALTVMTGPVGIIIAAIAALVAGLVYFFTQTETGQKIMGKIWPKVSGFIESAKDKIGDALGAVLNVVQKVFQYSPLGFITSNFGAIVEFFRNIPNRIGNGLSDLREKFTAPFRGAFDAIKRLWNSIDFGIDFEIKIPDWVPEIGGKKFGIHIADLVPDVALAEGGIVTGPTVALIGEAGPEAVIPLNGRYGMGDHYTVQLNGTFLGSKAEVGRWVTSALEEFQQAGGRRRAS